MRPVRRTPTRRRAVCDRGSRFGLSSPVPRHRAATGHQVDPWSLTPKTRCRWEKDETPEGWGLSASGARGTRTPDLLGAIESRRTAGGHAGTTSVVLTGFLGLSLLASAPAGGSDVPTEFPAAWSTWAPRESRRLRSAAGLVPLTSHSTASRRIAAGEPHHGLGDRPKPRDRATVAGA